MERVEDAVPAHLWYMQHGITMACQHAYMLPAFYIYRARVDYMDFARGVVNAVTLAVALDLGMHVWRRERVRLYAIAMPDGGLENEIDVEALHDLMGRECPDGKLIVRTIKHEKCPSGFMAEVWSGKTGRCINYLLVKQGHARWDLSYL